MIAYEIYIVTVLWGHTVDSRYYEGSDQACYMSLAAARNALEQRLKTDKVICNICAHQEPEAQSEDVFSLTSKDGWVLANITSCPLYIAEDQLYRALYISELTAANSVGCAEGWDDDHIAEWDKLWEEIYAFQKSLPSDLLKADDKEKAAEDNGLYLVYGPNGEKLFVNGELDRRLFLFRMLG